MAGILARVSDPKVAKAGVEFQATMSDIVDK